MPKKENYFITIYIYLICLIILHLAPFLNPDLRAWGFNHLIFLPGWITASFLAFAGLAMIIPLFRFSDRLNSFIVEWFNEIFLVGKYRYIYRLVFITVMASVFATFLAPTHFLGDGYFVIKNLISDTAILTKWSEIGVIRFMRAVHYFLGPPSEQTAELAFRLVSVVFGVITIYFFYLISTIISEDIFRRFITFILSTFSGILLLFFGYAEYYHIVWAFTAAYFFFSLKQLRFSRGLLPAWIVLLIGTILHLQMIVFIPSAIYMSLCKGKGQKLFEKYRNIFLTGFVVFTLGIIIVFIHKYTTDLYVQDIFLPLFQGKPIDPAYAIISVPHLIDIFNEIILISPMLFLFIILAWSNLRTIITDRVYIFLGLTAIGSIMPMFVVDPKLTMPRDWDLFSLSAYPGIVLFIVLVRQKHIETLKKFGLSMVIILMISVIPFLWVHLQVKPTEKFMASIIDLDFKRSHPLLKLLYDYYIDKGDSIKADSLGRIYKSGFPNMNKIGQAFNVIGTGDMERASAIVRTIKPDKFDADYHSLMGIYYYRLADYGRAVEYYDRAIQLRPYNSLYYYERAKTYAAMRKLDMARIDLQSAYDLEPTRMTILNGLADLYHLTGQPDSCIYYAGKMIELDSTVSVSYYYLAKAYIQKKDITMAEQYARRYSVFVKDDSTLTENLRELARLIKRASD